jgi:hypothetical protein
VFVALHFAVAKEPGRQNEAVRRVLIAQIGGQADGS